jgi:hypothetical protein
MFSLCRSLPAGSTAELRIDDRLPRCLSGGATPQSTPHIITRRSAVNLQRFSKAHSPECLEGAFCELRLYGVLRSSQNNPSTRGIPAPDCRRANSQDSCEVPSVWCGLRERSRFLLFFTPLVLTCNAQPLRCLGRKHISSKGHSTGSGLLQKVRAGRAVEDPDNLIRYAAHRGYRLGASIL